MRSKQRKRFKCFIFEREEVMLAFLAAPELIKAKIVE
eukprot:UN17372